jgi:hypothetical protein
VERACRGVIDQGNGIGGDKLAAGQRGRPGRGIPHDLHRAEPGRIERRAARVGIGRDVVDDLTIGPGEGRGSDRDGVGRASAGSGIDRGRGVRAGGDLVPNLGARRRAWRGPFAARCLDDLAIGAGPVDDRPARPRPAGPGWCWRWSGRSSVGGLWHQRAGDVEIDAAGRQRQAVVIRESIASR